MKYGQLRVTVVYNPDYTAVFNYHVWSWQEDGKWLSMTKDLTSVDNAVNTYFDVDVCTNPEAVYGDADNISFEWTAPVSTAYNGIGHGDNLDDFLEPGVYCRVNSASDSDVVANTPPAMGNSTFTLEVMPSGGEGQLVQRITRCHKTSQTVAQRLYYAGSWGEWTTILVGGQKVLWSGEYYMSNTQTASLSESITSQQNGIVLVFSIYDVEEGAATDTGFSTFFIPKKLIELHDGYGMCFELTSFDGEFRAHKYLYVGDNSITGHVNNNQNVTKGGTTYKNKSFVLRHVLGV